MCSQQQQGDIWHLAFNLSETQWVNAGLPEAQCLRRGVCTLLLLEAVTGRTERDLMEFYQNAFWEFAEFSDKKIKTKREIVGLEPRISCVRDRDPTTVPQRQL